MSADTRFLLIGGTTETGKISGISAAAATPEMVEHTPPADLEIVEHGQPVRAPTAPASPSRCSTPAIITRACAELGDFEIDSVAAGTAYLPAPPVVHLGGQPGGDIRDSEPVTDAEALYTAGEDLASDPVAEEVVIGETIPGGTTTALAVLTALGERATVSSSLSENPVELKREVVEAALLEADLQPGELAGQAREAIRRVGDPVLATVAGCITGATAVGSTVTLGGGTQMAAAAALARHAGVEQELQLATTPYLVADESAEIEALAEDLEMEVTVTDPGFDKSLHSSMSGYLDGEVKEGAGMGGALALLDRTDVSMGELRDRVGTLSDQLLTVAR